MRALLVYIFIAALCLSAQAGERPAKEDTRLVQAFATLAAMDDYNFLSSVVTNNLDTTVQDTTLKSVSLQYFSREKGVQYVSTADFTYLFCKQGVFKALIGQKIVLYQSYPNDSSWKKGLDDLVQSVNAADLIDSFLLRQAIIKSRKKIKGGLQYQLEYPEFSQLKRATITLMDQSNLISEISYVVVQPLNPLYPDVLVTQTYTMNQYKQGQPLELKTLLDDIGTDLHQYLQRKFPDYQLKAL